jgi:hypothetical protein
VGAWEQQPNRKGKTSVVFTISFERDRFLVAGEDEEDGTPLKVSRIRWDGESLYFVTVFPPTRHKAENKLRALSEGKISWLVSGTYADGEVFSVEEI